MVVVVWLIRRTRMVIAVQVKVHPLLRPIKKTVNTVTAATVNSLDMAR